MYCFYICPIGFKLLETCEENWKIRYALKIFSSPLEHDIQNTVPRPYLERLKVPYSGKFSRRRNFAICTIERQVAKISSCENFLWKFLPEKLRKLNALLSSLASGDRIDPNASWLKSLSKIKFPKFAQFFYDKLGHRNCEWIFEVSLFSLVWQFIANSYSHALISVLASYNRFNVVVQAWFPRQGRNFTHKIGRGLRSWPSREIKNCKIFSLVCLLVIRKNLCLRKFPAIRYSRQDSMRFRIQALTNHITVFCYTILEGY